MESQKLIYLNGRFLPEHHATVSIFDRGFLYGDGVFETMRAYAGRIFRLDQHIRRLLDSAHSIKIRISQADDQLACICEELLERNQAGEAIIRISVTRGLALGGIGTARAGEPTIAAFIRPPMPIPPNASAEGVPISISSIRKMPSRALNSRVKSMNYLNSILARSEAEEAGAYDAILLDEKDCITETSVANIFFTREHRLFTAGPESDILLGITRAAVLELAAEVGLDSQEAAISASEIAGFDECFLTNSAIELLPVTSINNKPVGSGKPGPIYQALHQAYARLVHEAD
jgi:branched-chain amino acid aminotransferase